MRNTTVYIQNLKCGGCENQIRNKLSRIEGIHQIEILVDAGSVSFNFDSEASYNTVVKTLKRIGYPLAKEKNSISAISKSYVSCLIGRTK